MPPALNINDPNKNKPVPGTRGVTRQVKQTANGQNVTSFSGGLATATGSTQTKAFTSAPPPPSLAAAAQAGPAPQPAPDRLQAVNGMVGVFKQSRTPPTPTEQPTPPRAGLDNAFVTVESPNAIKKRDPIEQRAGIEQRDPIQQRPKIEQLPGIEQRSPIEQRPKIEQRAGIEQRPGIEQSPSIEQRAPIEQRGPIEQLPGINEVRLSSLADTAKGTMSERLLDAADQSRNDRIARRGEGATTQAPGRATITDAGAAARTGLNRGIDAFVDDQGVQNFANPGIARPQPATGLDRADPGAPGRGTLSVVSGPSLQQGLDSARQVQRFDEAGRQLRLKRIAEIENLDGRLTPRLQQERARLEGGSSEFATGLASAVQQEGEQAIQAQQAQADILRGEAGLGRAFAEQQRAQNAAEAGDFGQPQTVIGPDGQPQLVQFDRSGNTNILDQFDPAPKPRKPAPSGFRFTDPNDPRSGLEAIPGGPGDRSRRSNPGQLNDLQREAIRAGNAAFQNAKSNLLSDEEAQAASQQAIERINQLYGFLQPSATTGASQATGAAPQTTGAAAPSNDPNQPPVPGAQLAPDGNWYLRNADGSFSIVEP